MPKRKRNNFSGFTLIELLIVIAILGILTTFAIIAFRGAAAKARDSGRKSDLNQYTTALATYASQNKGFYPHINLNYPRSLNSDICPTYLNLDNCPGGPGASNYTYATNDQETTGDPDGSTYVLWASLEGKVGGNDVFWVVCSTGKRGTMNVDDFYFLYGPSGICPTEMWID